jgi:feruloyl esterase
MLEQSPDTIAYPVTEEEEINEFLDAVAEAMPLSDDQKTALYDVYQGPRNENTGERFYRGLPIGSEFHTHGLYPSVSSEAMLSYQFIQLWTLGDKFDPMTYDFGDDYEKCVSLLSADLDAKDPDITAYLSRGGKLLMYAGTTDAVVPYGGTLDYVKAVRECVDEKYLDNFTFFVCPTIDHPIASGSPSLITCREDGGSVLDAIRAWVEEGKRPEVLYVNAKTEQKETVQLKVYRS